MLLLNSIALYWVDYCINCFSKVGRLDHVVVFLSSLVSDQRRVQKDNNNSSGANLLVKIGHLHYQTPGDISDKGRGCRHENKTHVGFTQPGKV